MKKRCVPDRLLCNPAVLIPLHRSAGSELANRLTGYAAGCPACHRKLPKMVLSATLRPCRNAATIRRIS